MRLKGKEEKKKKKKYHSKLNCLVQVKRDVIIQYKLSLSVD